MVEIGHRLLPARHRAARGVPVQIENDVEASVVQARDVRPDRRAVASAAVPHGSAVDTEPAVLVQRNTYGVDVPGPHRCDRPLVRRSREKALPSHAGVLGAGAVHAEQAEGPTVSVGEVVVDHVQGQARVLVATAEHHEQGERQCQTPTEVGSATMLPERRTEVH